MEIKYKKLGDICQFLQRSKRLASYGKDDGKYPFYTSSNILSKYCDKPDYNEELLIFGTFGSANIKLSTNFSCSNNNFIIKINNKYATTKYIYYYCQENIDKINNLFEGSVIQFLTKINLKNLLIPIPSFKLQELIVKQYELKNNKIEKLKKEIKTLELDNIIKNILLTDTKNTIYQDQIKKFNNIIKKANNDLNKVIKKIDPLD